MWPPTEIPGMPNVIRRLMTMRPPMDPPRRLIPRWRSKTNNAPMSPKIAPDAPTVGECGVTRSAPKLPASADTK